MLRRTLPAALLSIAVIVLASCGGGGVGYGVVLWGEVNGSPQTGAVVRITREPIDSTYLIAVPGQKKPREYPVGRIRLFKRRAEAAEFAKTYAPTLAQWAVVMKQDPPPLPIRETPDPEGRVVYKLKWQQVVKVVSRSAEKATINPYSDYWYEVATEDGSAGWCFGHFLHPFTTAGDPQPTAQQILAQDETLDRIMGTTWRPDWFRDMQGRGTIDLTMFREDVGLFPSPADKLVKLVLPLSAFEFRYKDIQKLGAGTYSFTGTDLRITALDEQRISVSYRFKDQPVTGVYAVMKDDVAEVIAAEQKRRADIYDALAKKGATLASSAYGTIRLTGDMRFTWEGFGKLVPGLISPNAKGKGTVDFTLRAAKELAADYDGAITLLFDTAGGPTTDPVSTVPGLAVTFLYKAAAGGLRLTSLSRDSIQGMLVVRPGSSPIVIFFSQSS
jgi:hypothetical protein